jgi:uncharacterized protein YacL
MLDDISNFTNNDDLLPLFLAVTIVDFIVIIIAKNSDFFGEQINVWYDKLGITAVILDIFIIIIGLLITRWIFTNYNIKFTPLKFIGVALIVQIIHDILLFKLFIEPHKGGNTVMEIYNAYAKENGGKIIIADAAMVIGSCLLAMYFKGVKTHNNIALLILVIYLIPYYTNIKK